MNSMMLEMRSLGTPKGKALMAVNLRVGGRFRARRQMTEGKEFLLRRR